MRTNYVLIDFESVQVKSLALLVGEHFRVHLFLGPNHTKIPRELVVAMHGFADRAKYVQLESAGPNALDFHIAFYIGELAAADPSAFFHIISKDTGFDPLIQHLKTRKIFAARSLTIEDMPYFRAPKATTATESSAASTTIASNDLDSLVRMASDDLEKRKAARPRRVQTLRSTVLARLGPERESLVDAVIAALIRTGRVSTAGDKVSYKFPDAGQ